VKFPSQHLCASWTPVLRASGSDMLLRAETKRFKRDCGRKSKPNCVLFDRL